MNKPSKKEKFSLNSLLTSLVELILCKILFYWRRMSKYLIHLVTGKTELERICDANETFDHVRVHKIEKSISKSSNEALKELANKLHSYTGNEEEVVTSIVQIKKIRGDSIKFQYYMKDAIVKMGAYQTLISHVERTRTQTYSGENKDHGEMLDKIWLGLKGENDRLESRITKRWSEIGFQGSNPATDFRGMGILALEGLNFLISEHNNVAKSLYSKSLHPKHGYPFAIVAINVISWTHRFLVDGHLKSHFYNKKSFKSNNVSIKNFYKIFVCLFMDFNEYWFLREPNVMQFEEIAKEFTEKAKSWVKTHSNLEIKESHLDNLKIETSF